MEQWKYLLVVKKRNDIAGFRNLLQEAKKRRFPDLIKRRTTGELKGIYDELSNKDAFALTITYKRDYDIYEDEQLRSITKSALDYFNTKGYIFYPDIDNNGNRHYHGIIKMTLKDFALMKRYFTQEIGFIKKEYLSDIEGWYQYMRKDKGFKSREHPNALKHAIYNDEDIELLTLTK